MRHWYIDNLPSACTCFTIPRLTCGGCAALIAICVFHTRCYGRQKGSVVSRDLGQ